MKYNKRADIDLYVIIREMTCSTLSAFCNKTGIELPTLRNTVVRKNCNLNTAKAIADGLEISLDLFYSIITETQKEKDARKEEFNTMGGAVKHALSKKIVEVSGTTVAQWCAEHGIPKRTIETVIVAKGCSLATANRISTALGITLDEFYDIVVYGEDTVTKREKT